MKISRKIYIALSVISFAALFLVVSGVDNDAISLGKGFLLAISSIGVGAYSCFKGGLFDV